MVDGLLQWRDMDHDERDRELKRLSQWAWRNHSVRLDLVRRPLYVALVKLETVTKRKRGQGRATGVMGTLTAWADEQGVILGLTPTGEYGADMARLTSWYESFGFTTDTQLETGQFQIAEQFYRLPDSENDGAAEQAAAELHAAIVDLGRKKLPRLRVIPRP
jgi:GNAT superfamily N-acetyltransferase